MNTLKSRSNYLWRDCYGNIKDKTSSRGINRNNTSYELIKPSCDILLDTAPLSMCYMFYLDIESFIHKYGLVGLTYIKPDYVLAYVILIQDTNIKISKILHPDFIPQVVYDFLGTRDYSTVIKMFKQAKYTCPKCNTPLHIQHRSLVCYHCELPYKCNLCSKAFKSKQALTLHYTQQHDMDYNSMYMIDTTCHCIHCKEAVIVNYVDRKYSVNQCTNKNCASYIKRNQDKVNTFKATIYNRDQNKVHKIKEAYRVGALKREYAFRNTILQDGRNKKAHISDKVAIKTSTKMKEKIRDGTFTPCVTNSWCRSRCDFNGVPYRSSFEVLFKLYYGDSVQYESTRIPYTYGSNNHVYIVDFTDFKRKVLYEIKPKSNLHEDKVVAKVEAAQQWCKLHDYTYEVVTEDFIKLNKQTLLHHFSTNSDKMSEETKRKVLRTLERI